MSEAVVSQVVVDTRHKDGSRRKDMFGRKYSKTVSLEVREYPDYGMLVIGTYDIEIARRALKATGWRRVRRLAYRPTLIGQEDREWPEGLAVGGTPAVAFYLSLQESM